MNNQVRQIIGIGSLFVIGLLWWIAVHQLQVSAKTLPQSEIANRRVE